MEIASIIERDLTLLESSHLVRETSELLKEILPLLKLWIASGGDENFPPYKDWGGSFGWDHQYSERVYYYIKHFLVPGYWKIPYLREKRTLDLAVSFPRFNADAKESLTISGNAAFFASGPPTLTIRVRGRKPPPQKLQFLHRRLKDTLAHELEHLADERTINRLNDKIAKLARGEPIAQQSKGKPETGLDWFTYLTSPTEVRAWVSGMLRAGKAQKTPFPAFLKQLLDYTQKTYQFSPEQLKKMARLYRAEYARRGYGRR